MTRQYDNYADLITFTRASTGTYLDSDGVLKTATNNVPRIEYDADGNRLGLLIEEARTNSIRNSVADGAVVGTPGSLPSNWAIFGGALTAEVVAVGTEDGTNYVDVKITGTPGLAIFNFESATHIPAAEGESWSLRFNARIIAGDATNVNGLHPSINWRSSGSFLSRVLGADFKGAVDRNVRTVSATAPATTDRILPQIVLDCSGVVDFTIRVSAPQVELGSFPTSYIPTSGATATRAADVASIPTSAFGYNLTSGTIVLSASINRISSLAGTVIASLTNNANKSNNYVRFYYRAAGTLGITVRVGAVNVVDFNPSGVVAAGEEITLAIAFAENNFAVVKNGEAVLTDDAGELPAFDLLALGYDFQEALNGHIKSIQYYPRRLSNAQLQEVTS